MPLGEIVHYGLYGAILIAFFIILRMPKEKPKSKKRDDPS
jgi:hypothetical protein